MDTALDLIRYLDWFNLLFSLTVIVTVALRVSLVMAFFTSYSVIFNLSSNSYSNNGSSPLLVIHGWPMSCSNVALLIGSFYKQPAIKSIKSLSVSSGNVNLFIKL